MVVAAMSAAASHAAAQPPPSPWIAGPPPAELAKIKPSGPGRAIVQCHVDEMGQLSACAAFQEFPAGSGYAQRLASLAPLYRMRPEVVKTDHPDGKAFVIDSNDMASDTPASWIRRPRPEDLMAVWPKAAWSRGLGGRAMITCMVAVQGTLYDCFPIVEAPAGMNFGAAAVALTPQLLMKPALRKGEPIVSTVNIPIVFKTSGVGFSTEGHSALPATLAWTQAPSYADLAAAYPQKARAERLAGHATVNCGFAPSGRLADCDVISEEPKGQGFGAAARMLAKTFHAPASLDAKAMKNAGVQIPFTFDPAILGDNKPAIGKPQWAGLPTAEETSAAFSAVTKAGVEGVVRVTLSCSVQPGGAIDGCAIAHEDPPGHGVGQAALSLTPHFRMTTWTAEGLPTVGGRVDIPLRYREAAPAPPAGG